MANRQRTVREEEVHPSHPFRNFLYFFYTLLNAAAFAGIFWFLHQQTVEWLFVALCAAIVVIGTVAGLINAMRYRKR